MLEAVELCGTRYTFSILNQIQARLYLSLLPRLNDAIDSLPAFLLFCLPGEIGGDRVEHKVRGTGTGRTLITELAKVREHIFRWSSVYEGASPR